MAWYHKFPWTNFHELNLDWILEICGKAEKVLPDAATATEAASEAAKLANNNAVAASDAATRANIAARKIEPVTATAATVYGASASVTVEDTNPGKVFHFLIPAGEKGDPGPAGGAGDLIGNGNFSNPVNQRWQTSYNGNGSKMYTIDRWFTTSTVAGAVVVGNRYITVAAGATISQIIPADQDGSFPSDVDVGYTAVARETNGTLHITNSSGVSDSKLSFEIGDAGSGITVTIGSGNWEYCALYRGIYTPSNVPGYQPKYFATQLIDCYRYYYRTRETDWNASTSIAIGSDTYAPVVVAFPVAMRVNPTVISNLNSVDVFGTGTVTAELTNATSDTKGYSAMVRLAGGNEGKIIKLLGRVEFSADT